MAPLESTQLDTCNGLDTGLDAEDLALSKQDFLLCWKKLLWIQSCTKNGGRRESLRELRGESTFHGVCIDPFQDMVTSGQAGLTSFSNNTQNPLTKGKHAVYVQQFLFENHFSFLKEKDCA